MTTGTDQPNIILIMTDHFRRDAIGSSTPVLRRLADQGVSFANAYCAAPLCQPARIAIATGLYPSQNGISGNMSAPLAPRFRDDTYMNRLRRAGYRTALIGKHHFIDDYGLGVDVVERDDEIGRYGFDFVWQVVDAGENLHNDDRYTRHLRDKGLLEDYRAAQAERASVCGDYPYGEDDSEDGYIGRMACEYLMERTNDQPFYLNVSFVGPHPPYWHPGDLAHDPAAMLAPIGAADSPRTRELRAHYMDKCALIDRQIGRILATLEQRGLREQTVVIFTTDHGDMLGDFGIWDKRFFYEASVGVPLIMAGPGVPRGARNLTGRVSKALVSHLDLYSTLLGLAGADPDNGVAPRAGRDVLPMLQPRPALRTAIFAELGTAAMVRTGNWKLVFDPEQGGTQFLFNLVSDPAQERNVAGQPGYEGVTITLLERLLTERIRLTQFTHDKEERRAQRVRVGLD